MNHSKLNGLWMFIALVAGVTSLRAAEPEALVTIGKGTLPIILSSPHGGRTAIPDTPPRKGEGIQKFVAVRDDNTAELTEKLADAIEKQLGGRPYVVIARFERKFADPNRVAADAYEHPNAKTHYDAYHKAIKDAAAEVKAKWGRGLLLDIHGQAVTPDGIYRGTRDGKAVAELLKREGEAAVVGPKSLFGLLGAAGYPILPEKPPTGIGTEARYNGGYIVDAYGSHQGTAIDAIQMEFGGKLRAKDRLDKTAADVAKAVAEFSTKYLPRLGDATEKKTSK
ncbi:N-formylglutamate amidohydrolase [Humisphaera borealis]|uniref:N-formylglutamate amidohydrolase n=1 Tax=Humisphaera borealis TaxID=2807512 RepID=A0A7M2WVG6_9BACT|nr:N-formylglutamate amidohydrolase [Humisphaera borealis]QOV88480.1 N-formylglutamate amidohydrolase [Humisphaera borealis]